MLSVHNAIDAMASVKVDHRTLRVRTKSDGDKAVIVEVEETMSAFGGKADINGRQTDVCF